MIRPVKTREDYESALARIEELMEANATGKDSDELEVLATLVELYEQEHFPIDLPTPIDAIRFRMEQQQLTNKDLEPLIGTRARVSEVLSGKRSLTLQMIRNVHTHLGIPAEVLLGQRGAELPPNPEDMDWEKFPLKEMAKLGWIKTTNDILERAEEIMRKLIHCAGGFDAVLEAMFRKNEAARKNARVDQYALNAWCYTVLAIARKRKSISDKYQDGCVTLSFCRDLVRKNSWSQDGPKLAKEYLEKHGIQLIHLPHLQHTHLDGAVLQLADGTPVVGLTLRYDRLDNFWFSLCHELAHIALHMSKGKRTVFVDDFTAQSSSRGDKEHQADEWAEEALIPSKAWRSCAARQSTSVQSVVDCARELGIHPAVVAGRVRKERKNYRLFTHFVGSGEVAKHFPDPKPLVV